MAAKLETVRQALRMRKGKMWYVEKQQLYNTQRRNSYLDGPTFPFGERQCLLRFSYEWDRGRPGRYTLSIVAEPRKEECHSADISADISAFLEDRNGPRFFSKTAVRKFPQRLLEFSEHEVSRIGFHHDGCLKFIFLFHGEMKLPSEECAEENKDLQTLSDDSLRLWKEGSNHDVQLTTIDNRTMMIHGFILKARSQANINMLPQIDFETLQDLVWYLYSGVMPGLTAEKARSLYLAAIGFAVLPLQRLCADYIISTMSEENAFAILEFGDENKDLYLKNNTIAFILRKKLFLKDEKWIPFTERRGNLALEVLNVNARKNFGEI